MWPTLKEGEMIDCEEFSTQTISVEDLIVFNHPFKNDVICVKRVKKITDEGFFVEGDNPDPLGSEDSHNFGLVSNDSIIAIKKV